MSFRVIGHRCERCVVMSGVFLRVLRDSAHATSVHRSHSTAVPRQMLELIPKHISAKNSSVTMSVKFFSSSADNVRYVRIKSRSVVHMSSVKSVKPMMPVSWSVLMKSLCVYGLPA